MAFPKISHSSLVSLVFYDPATGFFHRRTNQRQRVFDPPNTGPRFSDRWSHDGYTYIHLYWLTPNEVRADILAWFLMTGEWPKGEIEYIDGNKNNNAFNNLRLIPPPEDLGAVMSPKEYDYATREFIKPHRKPKWIKKTRNGKYSAFLYKWRRAVYLGLFDTEEEAIEAQKTARKCEDIDDVVLKRQRDRVTLPEDREPKPRKSKAKGPGPRGIMKQWNGTYHARIKIDKTYVSLGTYKTEEEALSVYRRAKARAKQVKREKQERFLSKAEQLRDMLLS